MFTREETMNNRINDHYPDEEVSRIKNKAVKDLITSCLNIDASQITTTVDDLLKNTWLNS